MATLERTRDDQREQGWRDGLPRLVAEGVLLRELRRSDATSLHRIVKCPEVARQIWPPPATVQALEAFIEWTWKERASGKYACFGIVPQDTSAAVGLFELRQLQPGFFRGELGFLLDPAWWGSGLFFAGARLLLEFAFGELGVHRIEARVSVDNPRSNAALEKIGARKEGVLRAAFVRDGTFVDQNLWAIVAGVDAASPGGPLAHSAALRAPAR